MANPIYRIGDKVRFFQFGADSIGECTIFSIQAGTHFFPGWHYSMTAKDGKIFRSVSEGAIYAPCVCKDYGKSFVPSWGEYARCQSCLGEACSEAEKANA